MSEEKWDLEAVHDEKIGPLMKQIIAICKEHHLPMFATFAYGRDSEETHFCTTIINQEPNLDELDECSRAVRKPPQFLAITITTPTPEQKRPSPEPTKEPKPQ